MQAYTGNHSNALATIVATYIQIIMATAESRLVNLLNCCNSSNIQDYDNEIQELISFSF
jgi:hypothetical protein